MKHELWIQWVQQIFNDPTIDEILVNGCHAAQVLGAQTSWHASPFQTDCDMQRHLQNLAYNLGIRLDPLQPAAGGLLSLADAGVTLHLRWHALLAPIARDGPLLSLRRHRLDSLQLLDFTSQEQWLELRAILSEERPLFIIGPTGSGKTSLLIALLQDLAPQQRVAILEQLPEIPRLAPAWIRVCAQTADLSGQGAFPLSQVFDELLRLRPDRLVLGELRSQEASAFKRSLLSGHGGVWSTLHAESPRLLALRLADLSGDQPELWEQLLAQQKAVVLMMQRKKPRLREAWSHTGHDWQTIFSAMEKSQPKSF